MFFLCTVLGIFTMDWMGKQNADVALEREPKTLCNNKIRVTLLHNEGAFGGLGKEKKQMLWGIRLLLMIGISIRWIAALLRGESFARKLGLSLAVAGGWNNLLESLWKGYVTDYLQVVTRENKGIGRLVFNGSDLAIFLGSFLSLFSSNHKKA